MKIFIIAFRVLMIPFMLLVLIVGALVTLIFELLQEEVRFHFWREFWSEKILNYFKC